MMLKVEDLHASYGRLPILNGIRLDVEVGEIVGIFGHNGMGKTTLLRALIGELPARQGRILYRAKDISKDPPHQRARAGLGYVPQGRSIFPGLSVRDNLRMGCAGRVRDERRHIDLVVAEFPRLAPLLDQMGGTLSGGEQQILALARCLCGNPQLLLLDEPTEGIQPSIVDEIIEILHRLHGGRGLSVLIVEQNREFLAALSRRVLFLQKGKIVRQLAPSSLLNAERIDEFTS